MRGLLRYPDRVAMAVPKKRCQALTQNGARCQRAAKFLIKPRNIWMCLQHSLIVYPHG